MTVQHLEELLLRPQATEASYAFLEQLIVDRVNSKVLGVVPGKDSLVDLLHVFTKMICRAGSGWIVVKSRRISRRVIVPILSLINDADDVSNEVIGSLFKLVSVSPVFLKCEQDLILHEIVRILKITQVPSVNMWRLVRSVLIVAEVGAIETQLIISIALANLAVSRTGYEAASCMEVLLMLMKPIAQNSQMLNTTVGLSQRVLATFCDDQEVRKLSAEILRKSVETDMSQNAAEDSTAIAESVVVEEPAISQMIPTKLTETIEESQAQSHAKLDVDTDDMSPRSSCPSLDL